MQRHVDPVARGDVRRDPENRGAVVVPAHRIAPSEHRERTHGLQTADNRPQACGGAVVTAADAGVQASGRGVELAADRRQPPAQVAGFEANGQRPELAFAARERIEDDAAQLMGELGFLSPGNLRTATLECIEPGEVGVVTYFDIKQLFFQNPKFGYYLMKLIAARLFENEARARAQVPLAQAAE